MPVTARGNPKPGGARPVWRGARGPHGTVTGMCGHDPQSIGVFGDRLNKEKGGLSVRTKELGSFGEEDYKKKGVI